MISILADPYRFGGRTTCVHLDLRFAGLFLRPRTLAYDELSMCCLSSAPTRIAVRLVDVLSAARLCTHAEVLLATDDVGRSIGLPVRAGVRDHSMVVVAGPSQDALIETGKTCLRLDVPGWISRDEPFNVVSLRAMTFLDFVGCGR
jgi:hypothetical protein